jgi:hypothetical protein
MYIAYGVLRSAGWKGVEGNGRKRERDDSKFLLLTSIIKCYPEYRR